MIKDYFLNLIEEQKYCISGVLGEIIKDPTMSAFFGSKVISIRFNDFINTGEPSTKLQEFVDKSMGTEFIVGPIEFIEYLVKEPTDNVLKDTINERIPRDALRSPMQIFMDEFIYFKNCFYNENSIPCISNMTLNVLSDKSYTPILGREKELKELRRQLGKVMKNNVVFTGAGGAGKTAIMEEAARIEKTNYTVFELDVLELISYKQQSKEILRSILDTLASLSGNKVLFIDEFHILVKEGLADVMKKLLSRSKELKFVVATTGDEFKMFVEKDKALERRFYPIPISEISGPVLKDALISWSTKLSHMSGISFDDDIVDFVTEKMRVERQKTSPDKEKDIIDAAFSGCKLDKINLVDKEVVADVMAARLSIPKEQLLSTMFDKISSLEDNLKAQIKGQDFAIQTISKVVKASQMRKRVNKPMAVLLFTGPTSTGKTEMAKQLAQSLFGSQKNLLQYNCTDYMEEHTVSALLGSPAGYVGYEEGGKLVNDLRQKPFSVVLFDEFEKAHAKVHDMLLPMLEEGIITDRSGRVADVTNCIIILTSNIGADRDGGSSLKNKEGSKVKNNDMLDMGFLSGPIASEEQYEEEQDKAGDRMKDYLRSLKSKLRPEFLARINEIVVFSKLNAEIMKDIARNKLAQILESYKQFNVLFDDEVLDFVVKKSGNNPRKLENAIQRHIESHITDSFYKGQIAEGDTFSLVVIGSVIALAKEDSTKEDSDKDSSSLETPKVIEEKTE